RIASRPTYVPALEEGGGTTARTMSPVRKPPTTLVALGALSGKPLSFVRHIWRLCRPIAATSSGPTSCHRNRAGGGLPTQAVSIQCVFVIPRWRRFHFVSPPVPVSSGSPHPCNRS